MRTTDVMDRNITEIKEDYIKDMKSLYGEDYLLYSTVFGTIKWFEQLEQIKSASGNESIEVLDFFRQIKFAFSCDDVRQSYISEVEDIFRNYILKSSFDKELSKITYKGYYAYPHYSAEDKLFVGKIENTTDLGLFQGSTIDEMIKDFQEAVEMLIELEEK